MSWGWTVVGTVVGSMIGGPVGAGIGMAIGRGLDSVDDTPAHTESAPTTSDFLGAIAELFVTAASIDGVVNQREKKLIQELMVAMNGQLDDGLDEDDLDDLVEAKLVVDDMSSPYSAGLLAAAQSDSDFAKSLLRDCWRICAADLAIQDAELNWLIAFAEAVELSKDDFMLFALIYYRSSDDGRQQALSTLGLPAGATVEEIKCAYRKLSQKYHPDKLMHLPPEIRDLAVTKFSEITDAFKTLTTQCTWYGKLAASNNIGPMSARETVTCFICDQKNRLPSPEHHSAVRCAKCQALLLHTLSVAEMLGED